MGLFIRIVVNVKDLASIPVPGRGEGGIHVGPRTVIGTLPSGLVVASQILGSAHVVSDCSRTSCSLGYDLITPELLLQIMGP